MFSLDDLYLFNAIGKGRREKKFSNLIEMVVGRLKKSTRTKHNIFTFPQVRVQSPHSNSCPPLHIQQLPLPPQQPFTNALPSLPHHLMTMKNQNQKTQMEQEEKEERRRERKKKKKRRRRNGQKKRVVLKVSHLLLRLP